MTPKLISYDYITICNISIFCEWKKLWCVYLLNSISMATLFAHLTWDSKQKLDSFAYHTVQYLQYMSLCVNSIFFSLLNHFLDCKRKIVSFQRFVFLKRSYAKLSIWLLNLFQYTRLKNFNLKRTWIFFRDFLGDIKAKTDSFVWVSLDRK